MLTSHYLSPQLDTGVDKAVQLVQATARGSALALGVKARSLLRALLSALRSPLAAPKIAPAHRELGSVLLPKHGWIADHVARTTIRYDLYF